MSGIHASKGIWKQGLVELRAVQLDPGPIVHGIPTALNPRENTFEPVRASGNFRVASGILPNAEMAQIKPGRSR
jgi:hypothetical protein